MMQIKISDYGWRAVKTRSGLMRLIAYILLLAAIMVAVDQGDFTLNFGADKFDYLR